MGVQKLKEQSLLDNNTIREIEEYLRLFSDWQRSIESFLAGKISKDNFMDEHNDFKTAIKNVDVTGKLRAAKELIADWARRAGAELKVLSVDEEFCLLACCWFCCGINQAIRRFGGKLYSVKVRWGPGVRTIKVCDGCIKKWKEGKLWKSRR